MVQRHLTPGPTLLRPFVGDRSQLLEGRSDGGRIVGAYRADAHDRTPYGMLVNTGRIFGIFPTHDTP